MDITGIDLDPAFCTDNIPHDYEQILSTLSIRSGEFCIDRWKFLRIFRGSGLSQFQLQFVWHLCDTVGNCLTACGLCKALACIGIAQAGQTPSLRLLRSLRDPPSIDLGGCDLEVDVQLDLEVELEDLEALDVVQVRLVEHPVGSPPFRHREFRVRSCRHAVTVCRRFRQFRQLHQLLMLRYPCRALPPLPPKSLRLSQSDLLRRQRHLQHFLTLICRHPSICDDSALEVFLTCDDELFEQEMQQQHTIEEFATNPIGWAASRLLPADWRETSAATHRLASGLLHHVTSIRDCLANQAEGSRVAGCSAERLSHRLRLLDGECQQAPDWLVTSSNLDGLANSVRAMADECEQKRLAEEEAVDKADRLILMLHGYLSACTRADQTGRWHPRLVSEVSELLSDRSYRRLSASRRRRVSCLRHRATVRRALIRDRQAREAFAACCRLQEGQLLLLHARALPQLLTGIAGLQGDGQAEMKEHWKAAEIALADTCVGRTD